MEYVPGLPPDKALARGDWASLYFVAAQVANGLEALHAAGVIHGDLKPSNLLVVPGPTARDRPQGVRLLDFGLSAILAATPRSSRHQAPCFAAPESGCAGVAFARHRSLWLWRHALRAGGRPSAVRAPTRLPRR